MRFRVLIENELRDESSAHTALWRRAQVSIPTARAEHLFHWNAAFGEPRGCRIVIVEEDRKWLAALALAPQSAGPLTVGALPTNPWQPSGELLIDESTADLDRVFDLLVDGLRSLEWPLFDFSIILPQTSRWRGFVNALQRRGMTCVLAPRFEVGLVDVAESWPAQSQYWSANHRRRVKRRERLLAESSDLSVEFHPLDARRSPGELLDILWRLESRSWKGGLRDAVSQNRKLVDFYDRQAALMSSAETAGDVSAQVALLQKAGEPIAAIYGWSAKDVCHLWKTAYDPAYADLSPGSLLLQEVLRRQIESKSCKLFNFMGPLTPSLASWATRKFQTARLLLHGDSGVGRAAIGLYRAFRRLRGREEQRPAPLNEVMPQPAFAGEPAETLLTR